MITDDTVTEESLIMYVKNGETRARAEQDYLILCGPTMTHELRLIRSRGHSEYYTQSPSLDTPHRVPQGNSIAQAGSFSGMPDQIAGQHAPTVVLWISILVSVIKELIEYRPRMCLLHLVGCTLSIKLIH